MANADDLDGGFVVGLKEEAIVGTAEAEVCARRLELLDVAGAGGE